MHMKRFSLVATCVVALCFGCGDGSTGSDGGPGGSGGMDAGTDGGSPVVIHGCTQATAMDLTGMANVTVTNVSSWGVPHNACIRVSADTVVTWKGNFDFHPLAGGVSPTKNEASPISTLNATNGTTATATTLATVGTYPYYCEIHTGTMQGVIYVE